MLRSEIIQIMYKDHITGRNHIKQAVEGAENGNKAQIKEHLLGYRDLLTQHIKKEDDTVSVDRPSISTQVGEMFQCNEADARGEPSWKYETFIQELEGKFLQEVKK